MRLSEFKRYHIDDFIAWRRQQPLTDTIDTVQDSTINRNIAVLSSFFNFCIVREYYNRINPALKAKLKENNEREVRLTQDQMQELLEKAKEQGKIYTAVLIALLAGLRRNEIISLKWSDIDFESSLIHLSSGNTKGNKRRVVCMPEFLKEHLAVVKKENPFKDRVLEGWATVYKLRYEWEDLREELSFKNLPNGLTICFHDLRHLYAQSLRDAGVSLNDIQTLLGHSSIRTTESRYAMFGGKDPKEKVDKIQNVIPLSKIV